MVKILISNLNFLFVMYIKNINQYKTGISKYKLTKKNIIHYEKLAVHFHENFFKKICNMNSMRLEFLKYIFGINMMDFIR